MFVGLVRFEEVFVAELFIAEFTICFGIEYLNATPRGDRRGTRG